MPIYLGFDSSTQGLTATAIDAGADSRRVLFTRSFGFDELLPHYRTQHGVLPSPDPVVVHAPPLMWAEALDVTFAVLRREEKIDWTRLRAISGSAQQHGSVYLNRSWPASLRTLVPDRSLAGQLEHVFARPTSPIWMDTSTMAECRQIEQALGGWDTVARLTGSRCYERFTGAQIRKFAGREPERYAETVRIHLVSSWLASLLAGRDAPIDHGDGSGMNLMSLASLQWSDEAMHATADGLDTKLPALAPPWSIAGSLAAFWMERHALPPARIVVWSGDNPCSLIGTGLVRENSMAVSLGTSDTVFGLMTEPQPSADGTGHVFVSPSGGYMGMTVFKNGSLARERIRDMYGLDWSGFSSALRSTPPGNTGSLMLPWFDPEITPPVHVPGIRRRELNPEDAAASVRALVEGQMMAMALHSRWMGRSPNIIHATGGASANREILQVMADVFDSTVVELPSRNSAALGAALRAYHADVVADGRNPGWEDIVRGFTDPVADRRIGPVAANVTTYRRTIARYEEFEREVLGERKRG